MVANADEEIKLLGSINPKNTAIIDQRFKTEITTFKKDPKASIKLISYEPNHLVYQTEAASPQMAVFSEIYYHKGWKVFIDGNKVSHFRADYVLRAMMVPKGQHKIEFKFDPDIYTLGKTIGIISSILLLLLIAGGFAFDYMEEKRKLKN